MRRVSTPTYNYTFNEKTGHFARWGKTFKDDPQYSPIGLEILDIEVSTICHHGCPFCYKSNLTKGRNMSIDTFKGVINNLPTLTQIAFGIGDIDGNPDLFKMFEYSRRKGIVPNVTINGARLTQEHADNLAKYCGAVAVSHYDDSECYNAVKTLTDEGMEQVNIHQLLSEESYQSALNVIKAYTEDTRLKKLNAIVFLSLKQRGRGENSTRITDKHFIEIIDLCFLNDVPFGFDSCTACKFLNVIKLHPNYEKIAMSVEPCESGLFSGYVNVDGVFSPCSFSEGEVTGYDLAKPLDFLQEVWYNKDMKKWRKTLLDNNRNCPIYNI